MITIALIGNPNTGKTTLFNQLTGSHQHVGNWPGVTVEKKSGFFNLEQERIEIVDLPGVYTLHHFADSAIDEAIAREYLLSQQATLYINVVDASHLERHLYLTAQLVEMQVPIILAVNMMDVLEQKGYEFDANALSKRLGCPVVPLISHRAQGLNTLKEAITQSLKHPSYIQDKPEYSYELQTALDTIIQTQPSSKHPLYDAIKTLEIHSKEEHWAEDPDILIASARYTWAHEIAKLSLKKATEAQNSTAFRLDHWILNRWLGIPIFLCVMYVMFWFSIDVGSFFQEYVNTASEAVFITGAAHVLQLIHSPDWLIAILVSGIGRGLNTTLAFIPVLAAMFFCLSFLEASGYMARAAFVMDKFMQFLGLPGKSLVPLIVGFGCNVPSIMGARTMQDPKDRILTIMMSPFMSCSARLAVYSVFVAAFFPTNGQNILFALYALGIIMAILTGALLRKTLLKGPNTPWIMELPHYHWPTWKALLIPTWLRTQQFIFRAGKIIVPVCLVLGFLNGLTYDTQGLHLSLEEANTTSLLSYIGQWITPIFHPIGITDNNWPATVGLITGAVAKEVVVGTLNTLYTQAAHLTQIDASIYGEMAARFVSKGAAFAYLIFVLLYVPCVSTMAAIQKELNTRWMLLSLIWTFVLAYGMAFLCYSISKII